MTEKFIIIHSEQFLNTERPEEAAVCKIVRQNIRELLLGLRQEGKKFQEVRVETKASDRSADVYLISDAVSAIRALEFVNPGDRLFLAGLYLDVCLALVYREARALGAEVEIIPGTSLDTRKVAPEVAEGYEAELMAETVLFRERLVGLVGGR